MTAAIVMLGVVVGLIGALLIGLLRSNADVLRTLHDLGVGETELHGASRRTARSGGPLSSPDGVAPSGSGDGSVHDIAGVDPRGGAIRIGIEGADGVSLLAFLSSGCSTCQDFWDAFGSHRLQQVPGRETRTIVVTRGPEDESPIAVAGLAPDGVTTLMSNAAWDDYGVPVSPYFMLVDGRRGVLGEGSATTWERVVELLERSLTDLGIDLDAASGQPSRRQVLTGMRHEEHASRVLGTGEIELEARNES